MRKRVKNTSMSAMWAGGSLGVVMTVGVAIWWCRGCVVPSEGGVLLPVLKNRKKPHKLKFTGQRWGHGGGTGLAQVLVWLVGCVADVEGGEVGDLSPEYVRVKKAL